eukprot:CAMPEP_0194268686 /NCGR_PEP_ID=MMETSP0169-20130528/2957_1 /TAXON_ID=218684 /ORGANISM="Corethron pennatum, Strain L29A3" /LENGTH=94 /DNA_ID=CAMNT_0039009999 /DNA_START=450 /DNA_END=731 /DNA_ORIENTATION=-
MIEVKNIPSVDFCVGAIGGTFLKTEPWAGPSSRRTAWKTEALPGGYAKVMSKEETQQRWILGGQRLLVAGMKVGSITVDLAADDKDWVQVEHIT